MNCTSRRHATGSCSMRTFPMGSLSILEHSAIAIVWRPSFPTSTKTRWGECLLFCVSFGHSLQSRTGGQR